MMMDTMTTNIQELQNLRLSISGINPARRQSLSRLGNSMEEMEMDGILWKRQKMLSNNQIVNLPISLMLFKKLEGQPQFKNSK